VAELFAMATGAPQPSSFSAWEAYHEKIVEAVRITYPNLNVESYNALLNSIQSNFPEKFVGNTKAVHGLVLRVATPFIANRRRHPWEANKPLVLSMIREAIPPAAREFEIYYTTHLLDKVFDRFHPETWPAEEVVADKLKALVDEVASTTTAELTTDSGELCDEELFRLYTAGYEKCRTMLLERYMAKMHELAPRIIHAQHLYPATEDPSQFAKDVAQGASLNLLLKLNSYKGESSFETWVGSIIENEAKGQIRKLIGRKDKHGKRRTYVSFEDLEQELAAPTISMIENREHREILNKALDKHAAGGEHNAKSARAIRLRHFDEMDPSNIATVIGAKHSYVYRLFSDDYPAVRRILIEDFGLSGTEI
jgi:RNA polymerase sigma factor (sigma-70 family)